MLSRQASLAVAPWMAKRLFGWAEMRKIGVWNTAFLGDAVLTLPLLQTLKQTWPEAELHFFVRGGLEDLFRAQPELAAVRVFAKRGTQKGVRALFDYSEQLRTEGFDCWISPHRSLRSGLLALRSGIAQRVGYDSPWWNRLLYTRTVPRRFRELEEIERLLELLRPLGVTSFDTWPRLVLDPAAEARARELVPQGQGPVLGLHPGSVWPTKRWPAAWFGLVAAKAIEQGARVCVFGGPDEKELAAEVLRYIPEAFRDRVQDLSGRCSLSELAACISLLDCYLSNDSGPMHLAWCQRVPLVALFGPTVRSLGFFPRGERTTVLEKYLDCRPCGLHGGKHCKEEHHACMRELTVSEVWEAVAAYLFTEASHD